MNRVVDATPRLWTRPADSVYDHLDCRRARAERRQRKVDAVSELRVIRAGLVPYEDAWQMQRELHEARVADAAPDTVLLLQHPPVYTAGCCRSNTVSGAASATRASWSSRCICQASSYGTSPARITR